MSSDDAPVVFNIQSNGKIWECTVCVELFPSKALLDDHECDLWKPKDWDEGKWNKAKDSSKSDPTAKKLAEKPKSSGSSLPRVQGTNNLLSDSTRKLIEKEYALSINNSLSKTKQLIKSQLKPEKIKPERTGNDREKDSRGQGANARQCSFCDEVYDKSSNLKNHTLNHFKDQLCADLPNEKPYACPTCDAPSRDKITLMRHYANTHREILKYCTEELLRGRPLGEGAPKATPSANESVVKESQSISNPSSKSSQVMKPKDLSQILPPLQVRSSTVKKPSNALPRFEDKKIVISKTVSANLISSNKLPLENKNKSINSFPPPNINEIKNSYANDMLKSIGRSQLIKYKRHGSGSEINRNSSSVTEADPLESDGNQPNSDGLELDLEVECDGDATVYFMNNNVSVIKPSIYKKSSEQECIKNLLEEAEDILEGKENKEEKQGTDTQEGKREATNEFEDVLSQFEANQQKRRKAVPRTSDTDSPKSRDIRDYLKVSRNLDFSDSNQSKTKTFEEDFEAFASLPMETEHIT